MSSNPSFFDYFRPADMSDLLTKFKEANSPIEQAKGVALFDVHKTVGSVSGSRQIKYTTSLFLQNHNFWEKPVHLEAVMEMPTSNAEENHRFLVENGWAKPDRSWWKSYLDPILSFNSPDVDLEVYICPFLFTVLSSASLLPSRHTYKVMSRTSNRHNPGAMWRFLGLDSSKPVFVADADSLNQFRLCGWEWIQSDIKWYRRAHNGKADHNDFDGNSVFYHAVTASEFGCKAGCVSEAKMRETLAAFYWAAKNGLVQNSVWHPDLRKVCPLFGRSPDGYGFDELFCQLVLFPLMVKEGVFSVFPQPDRRGTFGDLDLALCQNSLLEGRSKVVIP